MHTRSQHESTDNFCFLYLQLQEDLEEVNSSKNKRQNKTKSQHSARSTLFLTFINNSGNVIMNARIQDILFRATRNHTWVPGYQRASHQYLSFTAAENGKTWASPGSFQARSKSLIIAYGRYSFLSKAIFHHKENLLGTKYKEWKKKSIIRFNCWWQLNPHHLRTRTPVTYCDISRTCWTLTQNTQSVLSSTDLWIIVLIFFNYVILIAFIP